MSGIHCEAISMEGKPCQQQPGHDGWHEWRDYDAAGTFDTIVNWQTEYIKFPYRATVGNLPWWKRLNRWLDVPVFTRWWWPVIALSVVETLTRLVGWVLP